MGQFLLAVVLGGIGFAAVLTLISAIAARAGNGIGLMAILGFPLVLPCCSRDACQQAVAGRRGVERDQHVFRWDSCCWT